MIGLFGSGTIPPKADSADKKALGLIARAGGGKAGDDKDLAHPPTAFTTQQRKACIPDKSPTVHHTSAITIGSGIK
jgi:hypothetical protein